MVKVTKIAVWKIEDNYYEDSKSAEAAVRKIILRHFLLDYDVEYEKVDDLTDALIKNWDSFQQQVTAAMSGT